MALVKPAIFQIVGYQNSGKTTITTKLIHALKLHGFMAVTIKHHGHGGKPDVAETKDSANHIAAGAMASIVEGDGRLILQAENTNISLEKQIKLMDHFQPDVILIEGYKDEPFPKLLLLREQNDLSLLTRVKNVKLIMYWNENLKRYLEGKTELPYFSIKDEAAISWITHYIKEQ
jgi:molybdopterin-guanine dinucleotide biosynthesis protein B